MSIATRLTQTITHWAVSGSNGYGGYTYAAPTTIKGRWEETQQQFINADGEQDVSRAIAFLAEGVAVGDFIAEGDYTDYTDPNDVAGAYPVKSFSRVTNLRNTRTVRQAFL